MGSSLAELVDSFALHLRAANLSPPTVRSYANAVNGLGAFLKEASVSTDVRHLRRRDIEAYLADQLYRWSPATAKCSSAVAPKARFTSRTVCCLTRPG
jgi:site-specific recombinase XerD